MVFCSRTEDAEIHKNKRATDGSLNPNLPIASFHGKHGKEANSKCLDAMYTLKGKKVSMYVCT